MEENYEKNMIERAKKELKTTNLILQYQSIYGDKISVDGINYFNSIKGVKILSHNIVIADYFFDGKQLYYYTKITNITVIKDLVDLLNNRAGYLKYKIPARLLTRFENYKNAVDPDCDLSDFEIACMFELDR